MLQIRLSKPANETGGSAKPALVDTVTVACPDHLVLADLPVAKGLGLASETAVVKTVGRRSRRQLGERVHFCVQCDSPIAIYGRLSPCEHAFCLDCARSDSLCYLCDERILKIQTIKLMEGLIVCAAPHCFKSFLKKSDFESHINRIHADLLHPDQVKEGKGSEAMSVRKYSVSDSTVQTPTPRPVFSPNSNQVHDRDDKSQQWGQSREQPPLRPVINSSPFPGQGPYHASEQQQSNGYHQQTRFPQQVGLRQDSVNTNPGPASQFGGGPYPSDGTQQFAGGPYEIPRQNSLPEQRSLPGGFPPGPMNFPQNFPPGPWNTSLGSVPLEPPMASSQGRGGFFHGDFGQNNNMGISPSNMPPPAATSTMGVSTPQGLPPPPAIPPPVHLSQQLNRGRSFSGGENHDGPPGFSWQPERRDSFRGGQD